MVMERFWLSIARAGRFGAAILLTVINGAAPRGDVQGRSLRTLLRSRPKLGSFFLTVLATVALSRCAYARRVIRRSVWPSSSGVTSASAPAFKSSNWLPVHGGYAATLLDSACGCAVHSRLSASQAYTTLDLSVSYHKPITRNTGSLRAEGRVRSLGKRVGFAEASLTDAEGQLYASATSTLLVFDRAPGSAKE